MEENLKMAMLVLSCDKYSDLWDDFFNLRDKFWSDCPYKWYVVTESKEYKREGVIVIKCGNELNWSGRYKYALNQISSSYVGVFLDDYFIKSKIDSNRIDSFLSFMIEHHVSYLNLGDVFRVSCNMKDKIYYSDHLIIIPKHWRYGVNTSAAIWNKEYLLNKLGDGDYSAWQFELDRCKEAESIEGLDGLLLSDDQLSFNVSEEPVVIQGMLYPPAVKFFKNVVGYNIRSNRKRMSPKEVLKYKLKVRMSRVRHGRVFLKWVGEHFLGYKFFTVG